MPTKTNWAAAVQPLVEKYRNKPHPLNYKNIYQLLVMVILSAQSRDVLINNIAPEFFKKFPDLKSLSTALPEDLHPYLYKVINFGKKSKWIVEIAKELKNNKNIPLTMAGLVALPGLGRKSANVIMREAKVKPEGVVVDLHVVRVAGRLGISKSKDPKKIETDIMKKVNQTDWGEVGMAISHLGREICRPTNPKHAECVMNKVCYYYAKVKGKKIKSKKVLQSK